MFYTATISASEKSQQWQQAWGLVTMMQMTIVLHNIIYYKPPSVLVRRASCGSRPMVFDGSAADHGSAQQHLLQAIISAWEEGLQWQQAFGSFGADTAD